MSRHFQATLQGLAVFKKEMVKPVINEMPPEMLKSIKYYLLLKGLYPRHKQATFFYSCFYGESLSL